jgi:Family of unknown function (DUF6496)
MRGDEAIRPQPRPALFVREEMHHKRSEKHGRMTRKQAIAVGLSKARKAGIRVPAKKRSKR